ncbi:MAG: hypothetical protein K2P99_03295 [Burkholderiales bacterium]|nr:hypothetical protein [Burkholderiales bacterium]
MQIKSNTVNCILFLGFTLLSNIAYANEALDKKMQALPKLESTFIPQSETISTSVINSKNWSQAGLSLKIDNQWQLILGSQQDVTIKKISIEIDGVTVVNDVNLALKPTLVAHYLFASDNFGKQIQLLTRGYKILGIIQQVSANDYIGYQDYSYKPLKFTINWLDNNSYNETTINFMMVYAK